MVIAHVIGLSIVIFVVHDNERKMDRIEGGGREREIEKDIVTFR